MFQRSQQISSPLLLPLLGSILTTSVIASVVLLPPSRPTLNIQQLVLRAILDLTIAACVHVVTVWAIWRLIREYLEPSAGTLAIHIWAAVAWIPLIVTLNAERSLWISCFIPWAFANALTFLNLWSSTRASIDEKTESQFPLFAGPSAPPLWKTLLPHCITIVLVQGGVAALLSHSPWIATALFSAALLLFAVRHPFVRNTLVNRRRFPQSTILQTAAVFFLITTALTPYLQKAYGLSTLQSLLALQSLPTIKPSLAAPGSSYSGVVLTLPVKTHPRIVPPKRSERVDLSTAIAKPIVIPFDGAYWYFKAPDTRPKPDAQTQRGDPIKANVHSTDNVPLHMEAHQTLPELISMDCCHAMRLDLLNGDDRPGEIRVELQLASSLDKSKFLISLGSLPVASSRLKRIPMNRPAVSESLRFSMPASARGKRFDEITVLIKPARERSRAGAKIAIQNFVLIP